MESNTQKVIDILNGLVQINNDRIAGYHLATNETKQEDLNLLFTSMLNESINYAETLAAYIKEMGGEPAVSGTTTGAIHQAWLKFKEAITGNDQTALLESCKFGDQAAIEAYETALGEEHILQNEELKGVLLRQQSDIQSSLKTLQTLTGTNTTPVEQAAIKLQSR